MRLVSVRDLRNDPARVWTALEGDDLVLTNNGAPRALITRVAEEDVEAMLRELRLARARVLFRRLQRQAAAAELTEEQGAAEIEAVRSSAR